MDHLAIDFEGLPSLNEIIANGVNAAGKIVSDYLLLLLILAAGFILLGLFGICDKKRYHPHAMRYLITGIILLLIVFYLADYTGITLFGTRTFSGDGYY